jgi:hypothetical protein
LLNSCGDNLKVFSATYLVISEATVVSFTYLDISFSASFNMEAKILSTMWYVIKHVEDKQIYENEAVYLFAVG